MGKERDAESGLDYFGARYYWSGGGLWLSVDPLVDNYPFLSPYVYGAGNTVRIVDKDGRDIWVIDENGYIIHHEPKDVDEFYVVKVENGKYTINNNRSIKFDKKIVINKTEYRLINQDDGSSYEVTSFFVRGGSEAERLFRFLSEEITSITWVEYGMIKEDKFGFVITSHTPGMLWGLTYIYKNYTLPLSEKAKIVHSHLYSTLPTCEDIDARDEMINKQKEVKASIPDFYIYHVRLKEEIPYTNITKEEIKEKSTCE